MTKVPEQLERNEPIVSGAQSPALSLRDVQRAALRDLMELATQCAVTEDQIETQFRTATEGAGKEWEKQQRTIQSRSTAASEAAVQEHQRMLKKIAAEYEARIAQSSEAHAQACAQIKWVHDPIQRQARQQNEEAKWIFEGELESAQKQVREEDKKLRKMLQEYADTLSAIEGQAAGLLARCSVVPPAPEALDFSTEVMGDDLSATMTAQREAADQHLAELRQLMLPRLVFGVLPWFFLLLLCLVAGGLAQLLAGGSQINFKPIGIAVGSTLVAAVVIGLLLRMMGKTHSVAAYRPLSRALALGREAARQHAKVVGKQQEVYYAEARRKCAHELQQLKLKATAALKALQEKRDNQIAAASAEHERTLANIDSERDQFRTRAQSEFDTQQESLLQRKQAALQAAKEKYDQDVQNTRRHYDESLASLHRRLRDGLAHAHTHTPGEVASNENSGITDHKTPSPWTQWSPSESFPALVRFGEMRVDLERIVAASGNGGPVKLQFPAAFRVPASLAFPYGASLLIRHDRSGREQAISLLQAVMLRILMDLPPGRVRFTMIDPVGLGQNFAGFMRLADHDEAIVGGRIWTQPEQIEQRLSDMTEHMETVIQKYLRNEFATIDDYNAQAGELAEPYRFIVVADFPAGFERDAFRRLASIAATGSRCGVHVLVAGDQHASSASAGQLTELLAHAVCIMQKEETFVWQDDVFGQFPLTLDTPPSQNILTPLLDQIGKAAKASQQVEVSFDTVAPSPDKIWTLDSGAGLVVPIGRMGATRLQMLSLGRHMAQHALVAGKTGSGKSTLLHAIVTNLAMWYSPDQVELYLIDFKKGVEFKTYATHHLPHARAIAVESDREFGLSVLERLDVELARRGELFRKAGVQDLPSYRKIPQSQVMPRTLLVIDEFQEFFSEDDKLAQQAGLLMDRLVRQGRAFGIHLLLGSQTIGGTSGLARTTIGQMAVRIALQISEADSQLILGDNNSAARLLSRPGAAIYNDSGGLVEANSPFQVAWLPDEKREIYLEQIRRRFGDSGSQREPAVIFEGNAPSDVRTNRSLARLLDSPKPTDSPSLASAWVGEPVAIKEPTALALRRQSGANVLLVGQQEEQSLAVMVWMVVSLAAQYPAGRAVFHIMDGTPADSHLAGTFDRIRPVVGQNMRSLEWRNIAEEIHTLAQEVASRQSAQTTGLEDIYLFIYGLQRYRMLRKSDDDFGFSMAGGEETKKPNPSKEFADILRDGPGVGVHVVLWVDSVASLERTFERATLREFDHRILFQMSSADSSGLIDSPIANTLGFHRALVCSEEQGVMEKFRPYALPSPEWIEAHQSPGK